MKLIAMLDGAQVPVTVERTGGGYLVRIGDRTFEADIVSANQYARSLRFIDGTQFLIGHSVEESIHEVSFGNRIVHVDLRDPLALKGVRSEDAAGGGTLKAIMPGRIVRVLVEKGSAVAKGEGLLVLEAMKMENEVLAPRDGVVREIFVQEGQTVENGAVLVFVE